MQIISRLFYDVGVPAAVEIELLGGGEDYIASEGSVPRAIKGRGQ